MARKSLSGLVSKAADQAVVGETPKPTEPAPRKAPKDQQNVAEPAPTAPKPVDQPIVTQHVDTDEPTAAPRKRRGAKRTVPEAGDGERQTASKGIPVHLSEELNERLQAYMAKKGWSHQMVLLDAIEATYTRLPELIREKTNGEEDEFERTPLFERSSRPAPRTSGEARVKHTVRVTDRNRNMLDGIVDELGAPSRNFVITTAYKAYLPTIEKS